MDCDETFNYWEPLHFALFGTGLQTWEYSPEFALRTYAYLGLHGSAALPLIAMTGNITGGLHSLGSVLPASTDKVFLFMFLRASFASVSALGEALLCDAVGKRFGSQVGTLSLVFMASNAGMFHAAGALLPSSTCMIASTFAYWAWLEGRHLLGLGFGSLAVLLCWPFCALMFVPMGLNAVLERGVLRVVLSAIVFALLFVGLPSVLDSMIYEQPTIAILNLVRYNVLGQGGGGAGANLYGVEPWHFYVQNLALNHNIVFALSLLSPFAVLLFWPRKKPSKQFASKTLVFGFLSGSMLTLALFTAMPHKEERFLSVTYPFLCVAAALSLHLLHKNIRRVLPVTIPTLRQFVDFGFEVAVIGITLVGLSRIAALHINFFAPMPIYEAFNKIAQKGNPAFVPVLCVGKEWYRFPSSFFLPHQTNVKWIQTSFDGQLPQPFSSWREGGASVTHLHFNDRNVGDKSAFTPLDACDFAVDLDLGSPNSDGLGEWERDWDKVHCLPFLDTARSPAGLRSFYIPFGVSAAQNVYGEYCLFKHKRAENLERVRGTPTNEGNTEKSESKP